MNDWKKKIRLSCFLIKSNHCCKKLVPWLITDNEIIFYYFYSSTHVLYSNFKASAKFSSILWVFFHLEFFAGVCYTFYMRRRVNCYNFISMLFITEILFTIKEREGSEAGCHNHCVTFKQTNKCTCSIIASYHYQIHF